MPGHVTPLDDVAIVDNTDALSQKGSIAKDDPDRIGDAMVPEPAPLDNRERTGRMKWAGGERPPIELTSLGDFTMSSWKRFLSLWTKRFTIALLVRFCLLLGALRR